MSGGSYRASAGFGKVFAAILLTCAAAAQPPVPRDVPTKNPSSEPADLTVVGDTLFFAADDGVHGRELWMCDREGRCELAADIVPGIAGSDPDGLTNAAGWLVFRADTPESGREVWTWDPMQRRARMIADIAPGPGPCYSVPVGVAQGRFFFTAENDAFGRELWSFVLGSLAPPVVREINEGRMSSVGDRAAVGHDGAVYFYSGERLWRWTGLEDDAMEEVGPAGPRLHWTGVLSPARGGTVFLASDGDHGCEPWVTDGTPGAASLLCDIHPGAASSNIVSFYLHEDTLYFSANDGEHGVELWKTDGTPEGTVLVKDLLPGQAFGDPHWFASAGGWVLFLAHDGLHGKELWRTDGTPENTTLVKDIYPGAQGSDPWRLTPVGDRLYFCADSPVFGEEVWVSDGTLEGTRVLRDIVPGPDHAGPHQLVNLDGTLFFICNDGIHGEELWMSDGTSAGTRFVADVRPPMYNPSSNPTNLTAFGKDLCFVVGDVQHGQEVWVSDGSAEGTALLRDIAPGVADSGPDELTALGNRLFFAATDGATGRELWASNGQEDGTILVRDVNPGPAGGEPLHLSAVHGVVYFTADDGVHGREVWRSDGTYEGTVLVEDSTPGPEGTDIVETLKWRDSLWLVRREPEGGPSLWRISDDRGGPQPISDPQFFRSGRDFSSRLAMFQTDSAPALEPGAAFALPLPPVPPRGHALRPLTVGNTTYFAARTDEHGTELWQTDGSVEGTRMVCDAFPGRASSSPTHLCSAGGDVFFVAEHPVDGRVLWRGTSEEVATVSILSTTDSSRRRLEIAPIDLVSLGDTALFAAPRLLSPEFEPDDVELFFLMRRPEGTLDLEKLEIRPGPEGSWPGQFVVVDDRVFFTAHDGRHGRELWVTDGTVTGTHLVRDVLGPGDLSALAYP